MIFYMILSAFPLLPDSNAAAACPNATLFESNRAPARPLRLSVCPTSVCLSSVSLKSGCSGLLAHIRYNNQFACIPLPRFPTFIGLRHASLGSSPHCSGSFPVQDRYMPHSQAWVRDRYMEAVKGSSWHDVHGPPGPKVHVAPCVTDELLAPHGGAAIPNLTRSQFLIGTCNKPTCQKQSHKSRQWETIQ